MNKCVGQCVYFAECLEARVATSDPKDEAFLDKVLEVAQNCNNTPTSRYTPDGYKNCAALMAAELTVSLVVAGEEAMTPAQQFFAEFFSIDSTEKQ